MINYGVLETNMPIINKLFYMTSFQLGRIIFFMTAAGMNIQ